MEVEFFLRGRTRHSVRVREEMMTDVLLASQFLRASWVMGE